MTSVPDGFGIEWDGQLYILTGEAHEHATKTGGTVTLLDWRTNCPRCDVEFTVSVPVVFKAPTRRCPDCRAPGLRVSTVRKKLRAQIRGEVP